MKKTYKIGGLGCASCASLVEMDLEDAGFKSSCSFAKETLEVELGNPKDESKVLEVVKKAGYKIQ